MRILWLIIVVGTGGWLAFAQLDSDTVTVSVLQSFSLQPDQVTFSADVSTGMNTGLDDVITKLRSAGITSAMFSGLYSEVDPPALHWLFTISVAISELQPTMARLTALKLPFYMEQGSQVSQQLREAQPCSMSSLLAFAQARATKMADAVELVVGRVVELSDESGFGSVSVGRAPAGYKLPAFLLTTPAPIQPGTCSLTVKFKLLRYHY